MQWDPRFLEALSLEQEEADRAGNDLVQTVEECVSSGAVSLELVQTAAGGDLICLYYELTLPENWAAARSALHRMLAPSPLRPNAARRKERRRTTALPLSLALTRRAAACSVCPRSAFRTRIFWARR